MELIDKSALVAEIKRRIRVSQDYAKCNLTETTRIGNQAQQLELNDILSYLDTLEVKEVDLEKEIANWWNNHYADIKKDYTFEGYTGHYMANSTIISLARHFFELGLKTQKGNNYENN